MLRPGRPETISARGARRPVGAARLLSAALLAALLLGGCAWLQDPVQREQQERQSQAAGQSLTDPNRLKSRPAVNTTRNLYEGSLWRGAASWGNLLRDHRARYVGDLLTVNEMGKIIKVPEAKKPEPQATAVAAAAAAAAAAQPAQPEKPNAKIDPVLAFLKEQEKRQADIDNEQNEILRSVENVEVEVVRVLANGNLIVRGTHPPIFRDRNRVKYIITLRGIVRPSDVDDNNTITAAKLSKAEYKIQRLVKSAPLPYGGAIARASGKPKEGALLDRLSDFATAPGANRTTQVSQ